MNRFVWFFRHYIVFFPLLTLYHVISFNEQLQLCKMSANCFRQKIFFPRSNRKVEYQAEVKIFCVSVLRIEIRI